MDGHKVHHIISSSNMDVVISFIIIVNHIILDLFDIIKIISKTITFNPFLFHNPIVVCFVQMSNLFILIFLLISLIIV